jgi:hypothetical protein
MAPRRSRDTRHTRSQPAISYAEPSSDDDDDDNDFKSDLAETTLADTAPVRRHNAKKRLRPSSNRSPNSSPKKRKQPESTITQAPNIVPNGGLIPPWQTLPYEILAQIFRFATYPLYDHATFQPLPSGRWLLKVARLCKQFAEPAFTVLYASPPLVPMDKAHMLVDLLQEDPAKLAFPYRAKVRSLQIEVGQVAAYSLPGSGHLDIFSFVKHLPLLADLEFYHQKDMSPYRSLEGNIKWNYPESLFEALEYIDPKAVPLRGDKTSICKLNSWRWSSRLAGKKYPIESIKEIHLKLSFLELRKIAFVNYQVPRAKKGEEKEPAKYEKILADAIAVLSRLEHLILEASDVANGTLLPLLPTNLKTFELINCWEVTAEDLGSFLLTHGYNLIRLILNHNISLNLSFLPSLGASCPKLEDLRMNLTYFSVHTSYSDGSKPEYEKLLLAHEVPAWPSTLQNIELIQLRHWETDAAEMFFQSLLDAAGNLPDLRKLKLNTILNIGWRDRASFRDKWIGSLDRVFKRVCSPPLPLYSIRKDQDLVEIPALPSSVEDPEPDEKSFAKKSLRSGSKVKEEIDELGENSSRTSLRQSRSRYAEKDSSLSKSTSVLISDLAIRSPGFSEVQKQEDGEASFSRRSTRTSTRKLQPVTYTESPDTSDVEDGENQTYSETDEQQPRKRRISQELKILQQTAGGLGVLPESPPNTSSDAEDTDDTPLISYRDNKRKRRAREVIQGMCDIVEVRIDNLRPAENQVTEADFLDEEAPGDADWDGNDDFLDDGPAW